MDSKKPQPKTPTPRQKQTRRMMKAYLSTPKETRHLAAREARKAPVVQIAAKLAGAVHSSNVIVNVNK